MKKPNNKSSKEKKQKTIKESYQKGLQYYQEVEQKKDSH